MKHLGLFVLGAVSLLGADLQRGVELYNNKDYDGASKELRELTESEPENADARYYLGLTLLAQGKASEARQMMESAASLKGDSDNIQVGLARVYLEEKSVDKAKTAIDKAAELNASNPDVPYYSGMIDLSKKRYQDAAEKLEKSLELNPSNDYAHYYLGMTYSGLKRTDKMVTHLQIFLKRQPNAPESRKVESLLKSLR